MADSTFNIFGFEIKRKKDKKEEKLVSVVPPTDEDGAGYVTASGHHYGYYVDMDGGANAKDNLQLIRKYRGVAQHPEVDMAIEEIVNEAIVTGDNKTSVELSLDEVETSESVKKKIQEEFDNIYSMLNFSDYGHDIFRSWYIDGRIYHHLVVDAGNEKAGIQEIRYIDSSKIRKVKEVKHKTDQKTGVKVVDEVKEFYIYEEKPGNKTNVIKLSTDSVSYITSGLLDENKRRVVSYLHKAIKPINQLRMMEDSLVIYRLSRAPERRIFYIDVGNLPRGKAEQYLKDIMARYRNKLVYDANTGELKDDRKHMSMLEDFWLPRREGGKGTEISTLPGGENLGQIDDIIYFQKRVYRALNVPVNRLEQEAQFSLGRSSEISRDEVKFQKFVDRLRTRFGKLFLGILKKQLLLKNIITEEDWEEMKSDIFVDYMRDNHFTELKDSEILRERIATLDQISQYVGTYFTQEWVMRNVLQLSDDDIKELQKDVEKEDPPEDGDNMDIEAEPAGEEDNE